MDIEQLKEDGAAGRLSVESLIKVIVAMQEKINALEAKLQTKNPTDRVDEPYSERAEQDRKENAGKQRKSRQKSRRRGRISTADKIKLAKRTEQIWPDGFPRAECRLSHTRVVWRLEQGQAVLVAYEIHRAGNQFGRPPGVPGRGEFGIEVIVALAYQVYCVGLSIDKACAVLSFFQQLKLGKSQADALLNQLAKTWEQEFDSLCMLLANSAVVHTDETSWSINSVWAFLSDKLTVMFYGVHKDAETLAQILDKEIFAGLLISDDAAVYQGFTHGQKCWAHLIRKAIKLTLQAPENKTYRDFADRLLEIYNKAKRIKADQRLLDSTRLQRVAELDDELLKLCVARWVDDDTSGDTIENDFRRLCNEIMRLMLGRELFPFVTETRAEGNNNASERELRDDATARKTGRTSKTANGAKRRSIITSVLRSIGKQLKAFTLAGVIAEAERWLSEGRSCFVKQLERLGLGPRPPGNSPASERLLDRLILQADN